MQPSSRAATSPQESSVEDSLRREAHEAHEALLLQRHGALLTVAITRQAADELVGEWIDSCGNKEVKVVVGERGTDKWRTTIDNVHVEGTMHGKHVEMTSPSDWRCEGTLEGDVLRWGNGHNWTKKAVWQPKLEEFPTRGLDEIQPHCETAANTSQAATFTAVFEPGHQGIDADFDSGLVTAVHSAHQAHRLGVRAEMRYLSIGGIPYTETALDNARNGHQKYEVVFANAMVDDQALRRRVEAAEQNAAELQAALYESKQLNEAYSRRQDILQQALVDEDTQRQQLASAKSLEVERRAVAAEEKVAELQAVLQKMLAVPQQQEQMLAEVESRAVAAEEKVAELQAVMHQMSASATAPERQRSEVLASHNQVTQGLTVEEMGSLNQQLQVMQGRVQELEADSELKTAIAAEAQRKHSELEAQFANQELDMAEILARRDARVKDLEAQMPMFSTDSRVQEAEKRSMELEARLAEQQAARLDEQQAVMVHAETQRHDQQVHQKYITELEALLEKQGLEHSEMQDLVAKSMLDERAHIGVVGVQELKAVDATNVSEVTALQDVRPKATQASVVAAPQRKQNSPLKVQPGRRVPLDMGSHIQKAAESKIVQPAPPLRASSRMASEKMTKLDYAAKASTQRKAPEEQKKPPVPVQRPAPASPVQKPAPASPVQVQTHIAAPKRKAFTPVRAGGNLAPAAAAAAAAKDSSIRRARPLASVTSPEPLRDS